MGLLCAATPTAARPHARRKDLASNPAPSIPSHQPRGGRLRYSNQPQQACLITSSQRAIPPSPTRYHHHTVLGYCAFLQLLPAGGLTVRHPRWADSRLASHPITNAGGVLVATQRHRPHPPFKTSNNAFFKTSRCVEEGWTHHCQRVRITALPISCGVTTRRASEYRPFKTPSKRITAMTFLIKTPAPSAAWAC
jgi:hypothetical protein